MGAADDVYDRIARFYDLGTAGFDADIDMYEQFARRVDAPVLELGIGTGRVGLDLARRGLRVTGIDSSRGMLALAQQRARDEGLSTVELRCGTMERAGIEVAGEFGLIFCALDSFLHLATQAAQIAALSQARELLAAHGRLVLDLPSPAGDWGDWSPDQHPLAVAWSRWSGEQHVIRLTTFSADAAEQMREVTDIYEETDVDGASRRLVVSYQLRFIFPAEIQLLLRMAGLRQVARYGDYDLSPFGAGSERMIVVASREP